jgi:glycosyltransferase involved in cell wall biosynthesis
MRIGLVVPGFSADERDWCIPALRHLVCELARGDDVRVLALRYPHRAGPYPLLGARVVALGGGTRQGIASIGLWRAALAELVTQHRREPFDVLHAFWATESGALAAVAGHMLGVPVVVSIAGGELVALRDIAYGGQLIRAERVKVRLALALADVVTAGSGYACRAAEPFLGWGDRRTVCRLLPLGVDLSLFHPDGARPGSPPRLVHVASLVPVKDQATLLRALDRLRAYSHPFVVDIAGEGPLERALREQARVLGLADQVRFHGAVAHDALPFLMRGAAAFVLTSRHEAQCMALLEAAACGVPAVGSAVGALPDLAPGAALPVPPGDPGALADAIAALFGAERRRAAMGADAARRAREEYGVERCAALAREIYAKTLRA